MPRLRLPGRSWRFNQTNQEQTPRDLNRRSGDQEVRFNPRTVRPPGLRSGGDLRKACRWSTRDHKRRSLEALAEESRRPVHSVIGGPHGSSMVALGRCFRGPDCKRLQQPRGGAEGHRRSSSGAGSHQPEVAAQRTADGRTRLVEAEAAYRVGDFERTIQLARPAIGSQPQQAWRIIGASFCFLKDREHAMEAWNQLDGDGRGFLEYVCRRNLIPIP